MDTNQHPPEYFSLSEDGPVHRGLVKTRLDKRQWKLVAVLLCITWLPLAIITAFEGTLYSSARFPFLEDIMIQVRLLLALPMLIMIRAAIYSKVTDLVKYLSDVLISPEDRRDILVPALRRTKTWTNSAMAETILFLIVIALTISPVRGGMLSVDQSGTGSWMIAVKDGDHIWSFAGYWAVFISIPVFQFIMLRWFWKYMMWILLLFRISRMKLNLLPSHPDRAGGLGIIFHSQRYFILLFVAASAVISGELAAQLIKYPGSFSAIRGEAIGCIILCLVLLFFPLIFFTGQLIRTKHRGLLELGHLGADLSRRFESDWVNDKPIERRVSEKFVDPSALYDYSGVYRSLEEFRIVPVAFRDIILMVLLLLVPFIPILFIQFSIGELLQKIVGLLM